MVKRALSGLQVLPQQQGLGYTLGQGLGTGLGSSLQQLAEQKIQGMQQQQQQQGLQAGLEALGFSPQESPLIAQLPPALQREALKQRGIQGQQLQNAEFYQQLGLPGNVALLDPHAQAAYVKTQANILDQSQGIEALAQAQQYLNSGDNAPNQPPTQNVRQAPMDLDQQVDLQQAEVASTPQQVNRDAKELVQNTAKDLGYTPAPGFKADQLEKTLERSLANPNLSPIQKSRLKDQIEAKQKKLETKQEKIDKASQDYYDTITAKGRAYNENAARRSKLRELVHSGNLIPASFGAILDFLKSGISLGSLGHISLDLFGLTSRDTQEFKKITTDFIANIKDMFPGGRITDRDLKTYMDRIPGLNQSDEGKLAILDDLEILGQADKVRADIAEKIIQENGGFRPANFKHLVETRAKPYLKEIEDKFLNIIHERPRYRTEAEARVHFGPGKQFGLPGKLVGGLAEEIGGLLRSITQRE